MTSSPFAVLILLHKKQARLQLAARDGPSDYDLLTA